MIVYSYMPGSRSAKALAQGLGTQCIHKRRHSKTNVYFNVINWGATRLLIMAKNGWNNPIRVAAASNKLEFFDLMAASNLTPRYWAGENIDDIPNGILVVGRHVLNGHSGEGIAIDPSIDLKEWVSEDQIAPLYVEYKKKKYEFRVHATPNRIIDIQRKARRRDVPDDRVNWQVRNFQNGFTYARGDIEDIHSDIIYQVTAAAIQTIQICQLDFGAVDIIWNQQENRPYVLEVNTAPGIMGTTLDKYVEFFKEM